jgi:hypothetical protein
MNAPSEIRTAFRAGAPYAGQLRMQNAGSPAQAMTMAALASKQVAVP